MVVKDDADAVGIVRWQHLLGAPYFRAAFCFKTIIPDSEEHPLPSSRAVPKAVPRWIRGKRLRTIEDELQDVKRQLDRIWRYIATSDTVMADASTHIKELRDRQDRLEDAAEDVRAILSQRLKVLDDVNTITAYAKEMSDFLYESEPTERRAFIKSFVKEIVVTPGDALLRYTIPMPDDSRIPGRNPEDGALDGSVLSTSQ